MDVRLASLPEVLTTQQAEMVRLAQSAGLHLHESPDTVWKARQELFGAGSTVFKGTMLPSQIASAVRNVAGLGGRAVTQATGILIGSLPEAVLPEQLAGLRRSWEGAGGSLTLLRAPAGTELDRWGTAPDTLALMREVKRQFDPNHVLNPGRFVGGI